MFTHTFIFSVTVTEQFQVPLQPSQQSRSADTSLWQRKFSAYLQGAKQREGSCSKDPNSEEGFQGQFEFKGDIWGEVYRVMAFL